MTKQRDLGRRLFLRGVGGATLALPFLPSLLAKTAFAADDTAPFAIFFRQANGVAAAQSTEVGDEPERFWPRATGPLTPDGVAGRALDELTSHLDRLLVVRGVDMNNYDFGDGHARGAMQGLTARGPVVAGAAGDSEAAGESLDHRIGRELNPGGRDSLFMYAGGAGGWLGGPCISYRDAGRRRAALHDPWTAYMALVGGEGGLSNDARERLVVRRQSVNDLVRDQMTRLLGRRDLGAGDRERLELHFSAIRDLELGLVCQLAADEEAALAGEAAGFASTDGDQVLAAARAHMTIAALAVACGYTRSVAIQVGSGNDGSTRYRHLESGALMENFHFLSHRRQSHDSSGAVIPDSDLLHHYVDRHFARTFRHLLDELSRYSATDGAPLLEKGVAVWYNDNGNGPGHSNRNVPYVIAGGASGLLRQGEHVDVGGGNSHRRLLQTLGTAVGLRTGDGYLDDFGDPSLPGGILSELLA